MLASLNERGLLYLDLSRYVIAVDYCDGAAVEGKWVEFVECI